MEARRVDGAVRLGPPARQQFYDPRGIGRPEGDGLVLSWVETAYLLLRGDIDVVDGLGAISFLSNPPDSGAFARLMAYRDLRDRGYYLATSYPPAEPPPLGEPALEVRPRGANPTSDAVAYRVHVVTEATTTPVANLSPGTIAVVDDEAEVTYLQLEDGAPSGDQPDYDGPPVTGRLAGDRVLIEDAPPTLYGTSFFGEPIDTAPGDLVLNLLEARHLCRSGWLTLETDGPTSITDRGRTFQGERFDRRARVYGMLRDRGLVPRSGLKFGADFRVYDAIDSADDPGHSRFLVDVHAATQTLSIRRLSGAVRLATGVRKTHVIAIADPDDGLRWRHVDRLTP